MASYLYVEIRRVTDPDQYGRYVDAARPIFEAHGGEYVFVSNQVSILSGEAPPARVVLIRLRNRAALEQCFSSRDYGEVAPLRETSTESRALVIDSGMPATGC